MQPAEPPASSMLFINTLVEDSDPPFRLRFTAHHRLPVLASNAAAAGRAEYIISIRHLQSSCLPTQ